MNLSADQIEAVKQGRAIRVPAPEIGEEVLVVRGDAIAAIAALLQHEAEQNTIARVSYEQAVAWGKENPY